MGRLHNYRRPWSVETLTTLLDLATSPGALILATWLMYRRFRSHDRRHPSMLEIRIRYPWLPKLAIFVFLKTINRILIRLALNRTWKRSRPQWDKEIVVVTGGVGGIGAEVVDMLIRGMPGVRVAVFDMAEPKHRMRTMNVRYYKVNIAEQESVANAAKEIREEWGDPTMIVNNAGIMRSKAILDLTAKEFLITLRVNIVGAFVVCREFLPAICAADHGHIVTVASTASFVSPPSMGDYCASKAGVLAFHEVLSAELFARMNTKNVKTSVVCPVKVKTPLGSIVADHKDKIMTPVQEPWQVAERIVLALDSGLSNGVIYLPSYLWTSLPLVRSLPFWYSWIVRKTQDTDNFSTDASRKVGMTGGYRILADE